MVLPPAYCVVSLHHGDVYSNDKDAGDNEKYSDVDDDTNDNGEDENEDKDNEDNNS